MVPLVMSAPGTLVPPSGLNSASPAGSVMVLTGAVDSYGVSSAPVLASYPVFCVTIVSSAAPWWSAAVSSTPPANPPTAA